MYYFIGSQQQLNCSKGYQYESGETMQNITCSRNGWNTTGLEECVEMCTGEISYGNANSTWDPTMYYFIGSQQQLNCSKGYQYKSGETKQNITCSTNGWNTTGLEECVKMCRGEVHYGNANSTWDSALFYPIGSQQELKCFKGYQYESGNTKQNITCSKNGWNTTHLEECFEMCTGSKSYGNANSTWDPTGYYAIGSQEEMQCYDDYQYLSGEIRQNITCSISGWNTTGLEECVKSNS
ncbi:Complement factor H-related protein 3 [Armadillidium vulgare]|nr:Complement factor H-related protein 3 [Armadillidium vulgare]